MARKKKVKVIHIVQTKICAVCNDRFARPTGKSDKVWEAQKCCGLDCSALYRRHEGPVRHYRVPLTPGNRRYTGWKSKKEKRSESEDR